MSKVTHVFQRLRLKSRTRRFDVCTIRFRLFCGFEQQQHCLINDYFVCVCVCECFTKNLIAMWWCVELFRRRECETAKPHHNLWLKSSIYFGAGYLVCMMFLLGVGETVHFSVLCCFRQSLWESRIHLFFPFTMNLHKKWRRIKINQI